MSILGNTTAGISKDTITGAASTIVEDNLTAGKVLVSDASGKVGAAGVGIDDINPDGKYLKLTGGTLTGDLILGYDPNYATPVKLKMGLSEESGFEISAAANNLAVEDKDKKVILHLTPSSVSYFNGKIKFINGDPIIEIEMSQNILITSGNIQFQSDTAIRGIADGTANNDAVNLSQLKQYLPLVGGTMTGALDMGSQKIINVADGTDDSDVATVKQAKAGTPKGPVMVIVRDVTLGAAHEVIHNNLWDCTFLGTIYGTRYIDGVAVQVYPQSYIISVGGSDYDYGGGYCAVQKSANSMSVVIKMLCFSSTAPDSIQIPCLVW